MIQQFFIKGLMPNENDIIQTAKHDRPKKNYYPFAKFKANWDKIVFYYVREAKIKPVKKIEHLHILWVEKQMNRDKDNVRAAIKFILDGIVDAGIIPDDGWKYVEEFSDKFKVDKKNPGVLVTIDGELKGDV